jgi:hypothetical protein
LEIILLDLIVDGYELDRIIVDLCWLIHALG